MTSFLSIALVAVCILFVAAKDPPDSGNVGQRIPENVIKIADRSWMHCHVTGGNTMAIRAKGSKPTFRFS